jgi:hypothetical protein
MRFFDMEVVRGRAGDARFDYTLTRAGDGAGAIRLISVIARAR